MTELQNTPNKAQPFLKWAGGKSSVLDQITPLLPKDVAERTYREPFLGGGALFFHLEPKQAVLSDALSNLINTYQHVQNHVDALIVHLLKLEQAHNEEHYYQIRARYNDPADTASAIERAAWLIYLNKTCFNGLYRTNKSGGFNVPIGRYTNPRIVNSEAIRFASAVLSHAQIKHASFERLLSDAHSGDFVYLDPPYVPLNKTSSFSSYSEGNFTVLHQEQLFQVFCELDKRGCLLALSNSDTPWVRQRYRDFDIQVIHAPRYVSAQSKGRSTVQEVLVRNLARYS